MSSSSQEPYRKHSLGRRAFILFYLRKIKLPIFLGLVDVGLWYIAPIVPPDYAQWGIYIAQLVLILAVASVVAGLLFTWLEYRVQTYMFADEAFVITTGYVVRKEIAALYHQIQNVNINRSPMNRLIGISEVEILLVGADRGSAHSKIVLPAIGKTKARLVQKELLARARRHFAQGGQATPVSSEL